MLRSRVRNIGALELENTAEGMPCSIAMEGVLMEWREGVCVWQR